jgi:hypothetical protein
MKDLWTSHCQVNGVFKMSNRFSIKLTLILNRFRGYAVYSFMLKLQGLVLMLCTLKVYGVSGFGELQLLFVLSAFLNSVATFGSPSLAAGFVSASQDSMNEAYTRDSIVELLRFSSLNFVLATIFWFFSCSYFPIFANFSALDIKTILIVSMFGFVFQGNLLLLNILNALNLPSYMIKMCVFRIMGTFFSTLGTVVFNLQIAEFLLLLTFSEIGIFIYQVTAIEILKWISKVGLFGKRLNVIKYFHWIVRIRYQAFAGIFVAFSSLLLQNLLTVNQSSYENGLYNLVLRLAALFILPLSIVNLTIFSRRSELMSVQNSSRMIKEYARNATLYVVSIFLVGTVILNLRGDIDYGWLLFSGCFFMLSTAINSYSSNILIATQRMKEWALSDILLGSTCAGFTFLSSQIFKLSISFSLNIMSSAMIISSIFVFARLKRKFQNE